MKREGDTQSSPRREPANMHEDTAVWCDCCPCEAEPHWRRLAEELGIDLSDKDPESDPS